jgi:transposase
MQVITTLGLDIAKSVFQVHSIDAEGNVVVRRGSSGDATCWCSSRSCHRAWSVSKPALRRIIGHASSKHLVTPYGWMPLAYVKPYVKRHKNDATDAEAICEAATRPNMRFVATKTPEQQSCLTLHRTRHLFIR